jgi:SAM-dependent methyltransferase
LSEVFGAYSTSYDALYATKDYDRECDLLEVTFRRFARPGVHRLLDLGCGTGGHALRMAARGYDVTGVDGSPAMLREARRKAEFAGQNLRVSFVESDLRRFSIGGTYDAAMAMFAVMSYLPSNEDQVAALKAVRRHLAPGGIFIFDVWFGPGVVREPPVERFRVVSAGGTEILRLATPQLHLPSQTVDVTYRVLRRRGELLEDELIETHRMRFFFPCELELLLRSSGFEIVSLHPVGDLDHPIGLDDWQAGLVVRAV